MRKCILKFNEPTVNGRIYTKNETVIPQTWGLVAQDYKTILDHAYGTYTNATIEDDGIYCDIKLMDNFNWIDPDTVDFTTCGYGVLDGDFVKNFTLHHVCMSIIPQSNSK